jgi:hypothetical protein
MVERKVRALQLVNLFSMRRESVHSIRGKGHSLHDFANLFDCPHTFRAAGATDLLAIRQGQQLAYVNG